jgi:acyl-CoA thioesterase FadM
LNCGQPPPTLGTALETRTTVAHLGRTSIWFLHEIHDATRDQPFATLAQFGVHLDMAARRPAPVPEPIRKRAEALMGA